MLPTIHILATCRNPEIIRGTTLVFDTLRVGFPTSDITVYLNGDCHDRETKRTIQQLALNAGCTVVEIKSTIHHVWIEQLLRDNSHPFIISDTDMIFWNNCEHFNYKDYAIGGRRIPKFYDKFTNCPTRERIHGSFMYFNPAMIKEGLESFESQFPKTPFNPIANYIYPTVIPNGESAVFHDTCCLLYQALENRAMEFHYDELAKFSHLNCGTISDIVAPHMPDLKMREAHFAVFENPELARGIWKDQEAYYRKNSI